MENNKKNIKNRILDKRKEFIEKHNESPMKLYLTPLEEAELGELGPNEIGSLTSEIFKKGVREVMTTIFGMKVLFDQEEFKVE